jgi:hypothetical protein
MSTRGRLREAINGNKLSTLGAASTEIISKDFGAEENLANTIF